MARRRKRKERVVDAPPSRFVDSRDEALYYLTYHGLTPETLEEEVVRKLWLRLQWRIGLLPQPLPQPLTADPYWWEFFIGEEYYDKPIEPLFELYDEVAVLFDLYPQEGFVVSGREIAQTVLKDCDMYLIPLPSRHMVVIQTHEEAYGPYVLDLPKVPSGTKLPRLRP